MRHVGGGETGRIVGGRARPALEAGGGPGGAGGAPESRRDGPAVQADPRRPGGAGPGGGYVPALDGVRALSVMAVLAFHGGMAFADGGFLGVDAFFVLSGYLITSLLLVEWHRTGRVDVLAFWGRRARRLLPALVLVVAAVAATARWFVPATEQRLLRADAVAALFYGANWRMVYRGDDYFTRTASPSPLEHTWSLAVEEQFYLLWPLALLVVLFVARRPSVLLGACLAGAACSAIAMGLAYSPADPGRAYYGTDTRVGSIMVGAALAAWLARNPGQAMGPSAGPVRTRGRRWLVSAAAATGVVVVAVTWSSASGDTGWLYRGGLTVHAAAVASIMAGVTLVPDGVLARVLSLPPLRLLGWISYGLYLWHWPLFLLLNGERTGLTGGPLFALRCAATLTIAGLSYVAVEQPIRRHFRPPRSRGVLTGALAVASAAVVVYVAAPPAAPTGGGDGFAVAGSGSDGLDLLPKPDPRAGLGTAPETSSADASGVAGAEPRGAHRPELERRPGQRLVVDVFGDSVAWSLVAYLPRRPGIEVRDRTSLGCGITATAPYRYYGQTYPAVMPKCRDWPARWRRAIAADDPDLAVVLVGRWETMDRVLDGRWTHLGEPDYDAHLRARLATAVRITGAEGAQVLLATEPYNRRGEQPDGTLFPEDLPERVTAWNDLVRQSAASFGVRVLEFGKRVSPEGRYTATAGGVQVRSDGLHLTPLGVQSWIGPWFYHQLTTP